MLFYWCEYAVLARNREFYDYSFTKLEVLQQPPPKKKFNLQPPRGGGGNDWWNRFQPGMEPQSILGTPVD